jgi:hypothetical protein
MLKTLLTIGSLAGVLSLTSIGQAQALPTALARGNLQIGGGFGYAYPDYGQQNIKGISAFVDFDLFMHFGVEADIHYIALVTPTDLAENTFVIGPRYIYRKGRFAPYAKVVAGRGDLVIQETQDNPGKFSGNYFMFGIGGGLDIQATHHIVIRAIDLEYQRWPNLGNGLSPTVVTIGAAYRFR